MLNLDKVAKNIKSLSDKLFPEKTKQHSFLKDAWQRLVSDRDFSAHVKALPSHSLTPLWNGRLDDVIKINDDLSDYTILGVDGSQIYPDRHLSGAGCFLINVGGCLLSYGVKSKASLFSEPQLFLQDQPIVPGVTISFSPDFVDLKREEFELDSAFTIAKKNLAKNFVCLFDGGLIFWYLESKPQIVRDVFLKKYLKTLQKFCDEKILIGGYISFTKSKELANLIRVKLCCSQNLDQLPCFGKYDGCSCVVADDILDKEIVEWFLPPNHRTIIFHNRSKITEEYPSDLKPCFFYLNVGKEIVRVEIPVWMTKEPEAINIISKVCIDQSNKGYGYPVVLAEAHEQAVVKGADRDFFFHLIRKVSIDKNESVFHSQKSIKKRGLGI